MMRYLYFILISFTITISLASCYQDFDLDKYKSEPKIVLNSVISPNDFIMASVSKTVFFTEIGKENLGINNANVDLYINNEFIEKMLWTEDDKLSNKGIYKSTKKPKAGDLIKIIVTSDLGNAWAEDQIPNKISIQDIKLAYRTIEDPNSIYVGQGGKIEKLKRYEIKYNITFTDNAHEKNYYCIKIENTLSNQPLGLLDYSLDAVFKAQQSMIDGTISTSIEGQGGRTFSDEIINGDTYTMVIRETEASYNYEWGKNLYRNISLYTISEAYYNYLTALLNLNDNNLSQDLENIGLSEPTPFYSNINGGGVGIMGSVQSESKLIDLRTIFPEYWE